MAKRLLQLRNKGVTMFSKKCKEHLEDVNESGLQHMFHALKVAGTLQLLVPVLIIHSITPCFFTKTASDTMKRILENR